MTPHVPSLRAWLVAIVSASLLLAMAPTAARATPLTPVDVPEVRPGVVYYGSGWGHSVGLSQYGAYAQSRAGRGYGDILRHYYRGIDISGAANPTIRVGLGHGHARVAVRSSSFNDRPVPWWVCIPGRAPVCQPQAQQPRDRTWTVSRIGSRYEVRDADSNVVLFRAPGSATLQARHHGSVLYAPNPNGGSRPYRYGLLELTPTTGSTTRLRLVTQLKLEEYLRGLGEVPSSWGANGGGAALRAQAVAARTYALRAHAGVDGVGGTGKGSRHGVDCRCSILATPQDQVYVGFAKEVAAFGNLWVDAVTGTAGKVATYNGGLISTFYSSSHGGRSESIQDSWAFGTAPVPYLRSISDPWSLEAPNPYRGWTRTSSNAALARTVGLRDVTRVRVLERTAGGTPRTLAIEGHGSSGRPAALRWNGAIKGIAGASLLRSEHLGYCRGCTRLLPSQQIRRIGLRPFVDDDGSSMEIFIARIAAAGLTQSCNSASGGDRFCPDRKLTRAEMATFLVRAYEELEPIAGNRFTDVRPGNSHRANINAIAAAGLTRSCNSASGGDRFCPNRAVTRAEMATFLVRALDLDPVDRNAFSDVPQGMSHRRNINAIAGAGITVGCGGGRFCPDRAVTRAEMATFLVRALTLAP